MFVDGIELIDAAKRKHAAIRKSLDVWLSLTLLSDWKHFEDMKKTFNSVDPVKGKSDSFIFDIKGNDFRITAWVYFPAQTVEIEKIQTHAEYSKKK